MAIRVGIPCEGANYSKEMRFRSKQYFGIREFIECFFGSNYSYKTSKTNKVTEDDFKSVRPVHFDFGFIYAVNEHFRFGIHTQPYIITFYWKF